MATKADFTEQEWEALRKGVSGAGMLVSLSDRDFTDTFGEAGALAEVPGGQQVAGSSQLVRELAEGHGRVRPDRVARQGARGDDGGAATPRSRR